MVSPIRCLGIALGTLALLAVGCGGRDPNVVAPEGSVVQTRLATIFQLYTLFVNAQGRAPQNAAEFQQFTEALPPSQGGPIKLTPEFLTSLRDRQPLVIRYGLPLRPDRRPIDDAAGNRAGPAVLNGPVIAHEREGFGGNKFVVYAGSGRIEAVEAARWGELGLE